MTKIDQEKTKSTIAAIIFGIFILFILYHAFSNGLVFGMVLPILIGIWVYYKVIGDWFPMIKRGKQINFDSGIAGTLRGQIKSLPGRKKMAIVAFEKKLLPDEYIKENQATGWMNSFMDSLSGNCVAVRVLGDDWQWETIDDVECDNPHGGIRFRGNIWGNAINNAEMATNLKLKEQTNTLREIMTRMEETESQLANMAATNWADTDMASQKLKAIAERVKHVMYVAGKGATREADASSVM